MELVEKSKPVTRQKAKKELSKTELREIAKRDKKAQTKKKIEEKKQFIKEIQKRPAIWDRTNIKYRHKDFVDDLWTQVSETVHQDKQTCKKFWKHLVDHFRGLLITLHYTADRGDVQDVPQVTWPFFESMLFMKNILGPKKSKASKRDAKSKTALKMTDSEVQVVDGDISIDDLSEEPTKNGNGDGGLSGASAVKLLLEDQDSHLKVNEDMTAVDSVKQEDKTHMEKDLAEPSKANTMTPTAAMKTMIGKRRPGRPPKAFKRQLDNSSDDLLQEDIILPQNANKESNINTTTADRPCRFTKYLAELLRSVPPERRRRCESDVLRVVNAHADGQEIVVALVQSVQCDPVTFVGNPC